MAGTKSGRKLFRMIRSVYVSDAGSKQMSRPPSSIVDPRHKFTSY